MNDHGIAWSPQPPRRPTQVYSVRPEETIRVIAAGPVVGVMTHWTGKASIPCRCFAGLTDLCERQKPKWRGYLPAYWHSGRRVIVQITLFAVDQCPKLRTEEVTGMWLSIRRMGARVNGRVVVEVNQHMSRALNLVPYDPVPTLLEMWGLDGSPRLNGDHAADLGDAPRGGPDL